MMNLATGIRCLKRLFNNNIFIIKHNKSRYFVAIECPHFAKVQKKVQKCLPLTTGVSWDLGFLVALIVANEII